MPGPHPQHKFRARADLWDTAGYVLTALPSIATISITITPGASRSSVMVDVLKRITELTPEGTTPPCPAPAPAPTPPPPTA
jgi:hypothetical protein